MKFPECETCQHLGNFKICNQCKSGEMYEEDEDGEGLRFEIDNRFRTAAPSDSE